jgi:uncharacterized protein YbbC (DUF1343 family)
MTQFGLDLFVGKYPEALKGKRIGVVCHAASVTSSYVHIIEALEKVEGCRIGAIFGPQHGLFGQTQDNMIEWEGGKDSGLGMPVYSLYGKTRKPTPEMLGGLDALVFDIQDVGARPYTYVWTLKLCMEACMEKGIAVWVLDRPNPIGCVAVDGPMLDPQFFSFVGGAPIPLCHRLTMGEMAVMLKNLFFPSAELNVIWMENWWRNSLWCETGLPWVLPSPNMPTLDTAVVYPGMVLLEATNMSEGRGTTRPFEIFGAPYLDFPKFKKMLVESKPAGCLFREHGFIPTFQKWAGKFCYGMQIHVTNPRAFRPVETTAYLLSAAIQCSGGEFKFKDPPYEYETIKMPFDILSGSTAFREALLNKMPVKEIAAGWRKEREIYNDLFSKLAHYPENR